MKSCKQEIETEGRIIFINHTSQIGGAEVSLIGIVEGLSACMKCEVVAFNEGPLTKILSLKGIKNHIIIARGVGEIHHNSGTLSQMLLSLSFFNLFFKIRVYLQKGDVIYANTQKALVLGSIIKAFSNNKLIWHIRDILGASYYSRMQSNLIALLGSVFADGVIANSEASRRSYQEQLGYRIGSSIRYIIWGTQAIDTVYDGIDLDSLNKKNQIEDLGISTPFCVGVFGRITPLKNQLEAIKAIKEVDDTTLLIVGSAEGESQYLKEIEEFIEAEGIQERVKLLGFKENVGDYIRCCDIIVHAGKGEEALGRTIIEAMLCRVPVIASAGDGPREIIDYGKTGILYNVDNHGMLKENIKFLLRDERYRAEIANNAYLYAINNFDSTIINRKIIEFIERVLVKG
ncbi:D-inositol-3-phosphate glycosyltransferase [Deinococcus carri]|uniref:D-inositol-3-phosphate glycosyltransferase n=1 Tax=Deinococcus carri TaxID=1211323 RepID=A0ABP9W9Q1_9DEIO